MGSILASKYPRLSGICISLPFLCSIIFNPFFGNWSFILFSFIIRSRSITSFVIGGMRLLRLFIFYVDLRTICMIISILFTSWIIRIVIHIRIWVLWGVSLDGSKSSSSKRATLTGIKIITASISGVSSWNFLKINFWSDINKAAIAKITFTVFAAANKIFYFFSCSSLL